MKNKYMFGLFGFLLLFGMMGFISSQSSLSSIGEFNQGEQVTLIQICATCVNVTLTSVTSPDSSFLLKGNFLMSKNGTTYSTIFNNTQQIGLYRYSTCGAIPMVSPTVTLFTCSVSEFTIKPFSQSYGQSIFSINLNSITNIMILIGLALTSLFLFISSRYLFSGAIITLVGFLFLFNGISFLISSIVIASGVVIAFKQ